ncbi:hypothetical protein ALI144C_00685 [Actinosynnema sp. ALI-1.44]|uniref:hypothetical protein n=1 Tax=Actinosynnema sp. ALI-1.44 TaxID=1933779 RepID=UPI00097C7B46|nr:hypothetical protein [Actinosynnema sp. ALI-1.44]ONI91788.1 hypothetical protein ALI144C_00685 [Actinosynnema sp. ALI-1.44]
MSWQELLGHAHGEKGNRITSLDLSGTPTLKYNIVAARGRIPTYAKPGQSTLSPSPNNNKGYDYDPDTYGDAAPYNTWIANALPTGVAKSDPNRRIFQEIQKLEGQPRRAVRSGARRSPPGSSPNSSRDPTRPV